MNDGLSGLWTHRGGAGDAICNNNKLFEEFRLYWTQKAFLKLYSKCDRKKDDGITGSIPCSGIALSNGITRPNESIEGPF